MTAEYSTLERIMINRSHCQNIMVYNGRVKIWIVSDVKKQMFSKPGQLLNWWRNGFKIQTSKIIL